MATIRPVGTWLAPLVLLGGLLGGGAGARAEVSAEEAEIKAAFVFNFLKFVEWPEPAFGGRDAMLVVAVLGDGPTVEATATLLAAKSVGTHPVEVRRLGWDEPLGEVHAVFVGATSGAQQRRALAAAGSGAILSVGETEGFAATGGMIGLVLERQRVRFEINPDVAADRGLRISSRLLALAKTIYFRHGSSITQR